ADRGALRRLTRPRRCAMALPPRATGRRSAPARRPLEPPPQATAPRQGRARRGAMTEVLFYHLEHQPLERVLPNLVERTLERGWRAIIQAGSQERVDALDTLLWTYREDSFLPHGTKRDGDLERQPVLLTIDDANPNAAQVRFLVDGAQAAALAGYDRIVY